MNKPNTSILECPECKKGLVNFGSKVERIHPVARFVKARYMRIVLAWLIFVPFLVVTVRNSSGGGGSLGLSFGVFSLLLVPFVVNYFLVRAFPLYRITDCPYCGYHDEQHLGHSYVSED